LPPHFHQLSDITDISTIENRLAALEPTALVGTTNLNSLTATKKYTATATAAAALVNPPWSDAAFVMQVTALSSAVVMQTAQKFAQTLEMANRLSGNGGLTWSAWSTETTGSDFIIGA